MSRLSRTASPCFPKPRQDPHPIAPDLLPVAPDFPPSFSRWYDNASSLRGRFHAKVHDRHPGSPLHPVCSCRASAPAESGSHSVFGRPQGHEGHRLHGHVRACRHDVYRRSPRNSRPGRNTAQNDHLQAGGLGGFSDRRPRRHERKPRVRRQSLSGRGGLLLGLLKGGPVRTHPRGGPPLRPVTRPREPRHGSGRPARHAVRFHLGPQSHAHPVIAPFGLGFPSPGPARRRNRIYRASPTRAFPGLQGGRTATILRPIRLSESPQGLGV